jgi:hypothetical protein
VPNGQTKWFSPSLPCLKYDMAKASIPDVMFSLPTIAHLLPLQLPLQAHDVLLVLHRTIRSVNQL